MTDMRDVPEWTRLRRIIRNIGVFKGERMLSAGGSSNVYFDMRLITLHPEASMILTNLLLRAMRLFDLRQVGGPSMGAVPIAAHLARASYYNKPEVASFFIRPTAKGHGMQRLVEGHLDIEKPAMLVDDVARSGASLIQAYDAVTAERGPFHVGHAYVIVDRQEGASQALRQRDIVLHSLFTASDLV